MIVVDTSDFEFADFTKADELTDLGEQAAQLAIPRLKELIARRTQQAADETSRFVCSVAGPRVGAQRSNS